ncbi:MAG: AI-2E family transporter [Micrococcales bacterium]|nr:AI-2E family transporter [Micrococcales bacterium]
MPRIDPRAVASTPAAAVGRLRAWRRAQRDALRESNRIKAAEWDEQLEHDLLSDTLGPTGPERAGGATAAGAAGRSGAPLNRHSPFYLGFLGGLGALLAYSLWNAVGRLATTLTILVVALFLTLSLDPIVEALRRRKVRRGEAVAIVFLGFIGIMVLLGLLVVPPVVDQGSQLIAHSPDYVNNILSQDWVTRLDRDYQVLEKAQTEFNNRITDPGLLTQLFGGVLGAGKIVVSGVFQFLTILVLTLYFLASLPQLKQASYAVVPASRRTRVMALSEEIMRRVGAYAIGQVGIATINALCAWLMMSLIGIPYAAVLAVVVGFLGLVPMVGATLGALVVAAVAFVESPRLALIALVYFTVYQQIENYLIAPRVMTRTVSVPGAVTVVAALAGGTLLGVLGALLAIPTAAALLLIYDEVIIPRQRRA